MKRVLSSIGIAALLVATFTGYTASKHKPASQSHEPKDQINIDNFSFTPETLTVPAGTKVTWINHDDLPHTVVSTDKRFKSPVLDTDARFSYTLTAPGTYTFYCSIHPKMTGKVVVEQR